MNVNTNNAYYENTTMNKMTGNSKYAAKNVSYSTIQLEPLAKSADGQKPLFAMFTEQGSMAVYKSDNYDENNPQYIVKGIINGEEYEEEISVNNVDTKSASLTEIAALQVHLVETNKISKVDLGPWTMSNDRQYVERSFFEKVDYLNLYQDMFDNNLKLGNYRVTQYLDKILYELNKYI